jgi:hypothetical protein
MAPKRLARGVAFVQTEGVKAAAGMFEWRLARGLMLPSHRTILLGLLTVASGAWTVGAQTFDSSGNSVLNGAYFVREVMFTQVDTNGNIGQGQSAVGTVTFDGKGNYTFNGQVMVSTVGSTASTTSVTGTYKVGANHLMQLTSIFPNIDQNSATAAINVEYGGVGAAGPPAFVASATEGKTTTLSLEFRFRRTLPMPASAAAIPRPISVSRRPMSIPSARRDLR